MKDKLALLQSYIDIQATDNNVWLTPTVNYLQAEMRKLVWLIEDGTLDDIREAIIKYKFRVGI